MRSPFPSPLKLTLTALAILVATPTLAHAAWSTPETVSLTSTSTDTSSPTLTTNSAGEAVLVWREGTTVVRAAIRPAAGPFGTSQTIDANTGSYSPTPHVGLAPGGRATAVWFANNGGRKIRYADRAAGATTFSSAQDLYTPTEDAGGLDVALDTGNATHVAFNSPGTCCGYGAVWATTRGGGAGDSFAAPGRITGNLTYGAPGQITLATAPNGRSVLTFYTPDADVSPGSQQQHIIGAVRALGDAGWSFAPSSGDNWFCCYSMGPQGVSSLALDPSGNAYFTVNGVNDAGIPAKPGPNFVLAGAGGTVTQGRQQLDSSWSNSGVGGTNGGASQLAVDASGNSWVAWAKQDGSEYRLYAAFRPAGAASTFTVPQLVAADLSASFTGTFRLAAAASGAVLGWLGNCTAGACDLKSASASTAGGQFVAGDSLAAQAKDGHVIQLAALPGAEALAVYRQKDGDLKATRFFTAASESPGDGGGGGTTPPETQPDPDDGTTTPPLGVVSAPKSFDATKAVKTGVPVTAEIGTAGSRVEATLLARGALFAAAKLRVVGRTVKRGVAAGKVKLRVKLTRKAAKQLRKRRKVKLTLRVVVTAPDGTRATKSRGITLKRR
jgi:hypothetical protein